MTVETLFACDAMLGGLARWLRAAGYDASWKEGIDDHDLIRLSRDEARTLISSDTKIFHFAVIRDGIQPAEPRSSRWWNEAHIPCVQPRSLDPLRPSHRWPRCADRSTRLTSSAATVR
jgi:uncharacterized protein with PIN domain